MLIKSDDTHNHSVLFNRVRDLTAEIWFGRRLGGMPRQRNWALTAHWHSAKSISNFINYLTARMWFTMPGANMHMLMKS